MLNTHYLQSSNAPVAKRISRNPLMLATAALMLSAVALPASAAWWDATPSLSIGSTTINVHNKGARGNGVHNDTVAFQAAINALPSSGGTVYVPAGRYMIDALKSVQLRSHVRLRLDSGAKLVAIPNSSAYSAVVTARKVNNVEITGGEVIGERVRHRGNSGEWGQGVNILESSKVYVHNIKLSQCWGDGLYIGTQKRAGSGVTPTDITISHVTSDNNRRMGFSIGPANRVFVTNSVFSNTDGNSPNAKAGIDIEPMSMGKTTNVRIVGNLMVGNAGNGLEVHDGVSALVVTGNTLRSNRGFGIYTGSPINTSVYSNTITTNGLQGVYFGHTTRTTSLTDNKIMFNSTRYVPPTSHYSDRSRDLTIAKTTRDITNRRNTFSH